MPREGLPVKVVPGQGLPVEVVRSERRRKTVQARFVDGRLRILLPARLSAEEEEHWIREMHRRFDRHGKSADIDLPARAKRLASELDLPAPAGIRWVSNQDGRWGSCTPSTGQIRLSDRLSGFPGWVIDYVVVHELAHLVEHGHGPRFRALEQRYARTERAIGFLLAKGLDPNDELDDTGHGEIAANAENTGHDDTGRDDTTENTGQVENAGHDDPVPVTPRTPARRMPRATPAGVSQLPFPR